MDLSNEEAGEIPIPITTSSYGGGGHGHRHGQSHMIHHHELIPTPNNPQNHIIIIPSSSSSPPPPPPPQLPSSNGRRPITTTTPAEAAMVVEDHHHHDMPNYKKVQVAIRYRECLKNHAAAMGGNAMDGCGEFMPSGEEGTLEALNCSACNCHRNFHRKEIEGCDHSSSSCDVCYHHHHHSSHLNRLELGRKLILGPTPQKGGGGMLGGPPAEALGGYHSSSTGAALLHSSSRAAQAHPISHRHMIMSYNLAAGGSLLPSESDAEQEGGGGGGIVPIRPVVPQQLVKKRFRTKFTPEQKEKMLIFAEKVGWRMQKQEEGVVHQFCQEIGVKRRVLKVWMHNNKHNLAKTKNAPPPSS